MSTPKLPPEPTLGTVAGTIATGRKRHLSAYAALFPAFIIVFASPSVATVALEHPDIDFHRQQGATGQHLCRSTESSERLFTTARWIISLQNCRSCSASRSSLAA